jgi:hypothetical protein
MIFLNGDATFRRKSDGKTSHSYHISMTGRGPETSQPVVVNYYQYDPGTGEFLEVAPFIIDWNTFVRSFKTDKHNNELEDVLSDWLFFSEIYERVLFAPHLPQ